MKIVQEHKIIFTMLVFALLCLGCQKEEMTPLPTPAVTNAPPVPVPAKPVALISVTNQPPAPTKTLSPLEARSHVGETATVRGKVFGVHVSQKGDVFISMGNAYPSAPFTAVCFQNALPTDTLKKLDGKMISVTGMIKDYSGQIEIILERAEQISE